ncbi:MAG: glycosyltransferase family 4 protein [Chitinophaga sp.]|uniref:MraY family glycosyltransferase n=1 Tax=Chitinophaga sp. TaxID=1869181 RepID=UPI001B219B9D|nr:glycosyltransferase family 4 protein [Chitinophaga sp.]MBO9732314.1 glycosyltransferase family 4 protein [Chitinophaga sp.]
MMYLILTILFFVAMLAYFGIARRFNIIDKPNERSSHQTVTIRGGGIIFLVAAIAAVVLYPQTFWPAALGMGIIGGVSFVDDMYSLPNKVRVLFHFTAVTLMFYYLAAFSLFPVYVVAALYILVIGIINAYNFMDGINGITGCYSLVTLAALQYVNYREVSFIETDIIWLPMLASAVFLVFNFRKKALCFAGDVGSVTIAFWIITLLLKLIFITGDWKYLLFLAVYGVDASLTIIHRLLLKQNIFKAHRLHFYQLLANERKLPHRAVAAGYGLCQLLLNAFIINNQASLLWTLLTVCAPLILIYVLIKPALMNTKTIG